MTVIWVRLVVIVIAYEAPAVHLIKSTQIVVLESHVKLSLPNFSLSRMRKVLEVLGWEIKSTEFSN